MLSGTSSNPANIKAIAIIIATQNIENASTPALQIAASNGLTCLNAKKALLQSIPCSTCIAVIRSCNSFYSYSSTFENNILCCS